MKPTGMSRKVDDLGRIVIPKEIRSNLNINVGDALEIYIGDNYVAFKKPDALKNESTEAKG